MSDSDIIVALGDTGAVASRLNLTLPRVSNWKTRGIAKRYRSEIAKMAKRRKIALPKDFMFR